ncbi:MAG: chemotaxis protein CheW [Planctomycetia bacterium]|nr:chemotaxis protein CheW [Planctomycetia bacterium]
MSPSIPTEAAAALYCTYWVNQQWFGVDAQYVREVHAVTDLTPVPGAPAGAAGYVNLRGQLFLVLDARVLLLGERRSKQESTQLVVFRATAGESFALLVDVLADMLYVSGDQIDAPDADRLNIARDGVTVGSARMEDGLLTLIDPRQLLPAVFSGPVKI